jgi:hypothetical protein
VRARLGGVLLLALCAWTLTAPSVASAQLLRLPLPHLGSFAEPKGLAFAQGESQVYAIDGRSEVQQVTVSATSGQFKLEFEGAETAPLEYEAKASEVRDALEAAICAGEECISVPSGQGNGTGSNPYEILFVATLATTDVEELTCLPGTLAGGSGCSVTTTTDGVDGSITRYNSTGSPAPFSELLGSNQIDGLGGADKVEPPPEGLHFGTNAKLVQVAVDESGGASDGDVYVTQFADHLVDIFSESGEFLGQLTEYKDGVPKPLGQVCGVAVDGGGNVYVADAASGIHKYDPAGDPVTNADSVANFTGVEAPCTLAAGAGPTAGFLFVDSFFGGLFKLKATNGEVQYGGAPIATNSTTVTVDPVSGHVLSAGGGEAREIDASGESSATLLGSIAAGSTVNGVAVDGAPGLGGTVYLSRAAVTHLDAYGPFVEMPVVEAKAPKPISGTTATLRGTISADGGPNASCHFEYLPKATFQAQEKAAKEASEPKSKGEIAEAAFAGAVSVPCEPPGPFTGSTSNEVSGEAVGLAPETEYEFRLVGSNANGSLPSSPLAFETFGKPVVEGGVASQVTATTALVSGAVNPRGSETEAAVQYVTREQFEATGFAGATVVPLPNLPPEVTGSGDLGHATGIGSLAAGSTTLTDLATESGQFEAGQTISAPGIPPDTTIVQGSKTGGGLILSKQATQTIGKASGNGDLSEGSSTVLNVSGNGFAAGQTITAPGIPQGTTILSCSPSCATPIALTLSAPVQAGKSASGVTLIAFLQVTATSTQVAHLSTTAGRFGPGQAISGAGIPGATTVLSAQEGQLTLSKAASERVLGTSLTATGPQPVSLELTGLAPDTRYVFRLIAQSASGEAEPQGEAGGFATFALPGPPLPEGRAYEMVSPAQKAGEPYVPESELRLGLGGSCRLCTPGYDRERMPMQASADGSAIAFEGDPFEAGLAPKANEYLARRGPGGWQTAGLSSPTYRDSTASKAGFKALSPDLSRAVVLQASPALSPEAPEGFANLYLRETDDPALATAITAAPEHRSAGEFRVEYAGANAGTEAVEPFTHVIFQANDSLTPEDPGIAPQAPLVGEEERDLYEWSGGELHLVNVLPGNGAAAPNAVIGSGRLLKAGTGAENFDFDHAISSDGQRIFWSAVPSGQLYVREGGTTTTEIPDPGRFLTATPEGSEVLLSDGMLYDLEDQTLTDLTAGQGGFLGIAGTSEDLRRIYFLDSEVLAAGATDTEPNLYLWEEGEVPHEGTTTFIATLLASDNEGGGELGVWHAAASNRVAQTSADGRFLAFESRAPLSGYDSSIRDAAGCGEGLKHLGTPQCFEVFEYDAQAQTLTCASCSPSEERPLGPSNLALFRGHGEFFAVPANLPPEGEGRLFFESQDALTQADANGGVQDVYEWEPSGVGGCARAGGCVALISNGRSPKDSHFLAADADGSDVFFTTRERLVAADTDDFLDVYDARVGGGFEEEGLAPCAGEACAGPILAAPPFEAPASSRTEAEGPVRRPACRRGYVRRHGHCVRRHHRHRAAKHRRGGRGR